MMSTKKNFFLFIATTHPSKRHIKFPILRLLFPTKKKQKKTLVFTFNGMEKEDIKVHELKLRDEKKE